MRYATNPKVHQLNQELLTQPSAFDNRFTHSADCDLRRTLFLSLSALKPEYLHLFFPHGPPSDRSEPWSLRSAQGAADGSEYSAAAKGTACGHIFKNGESTYHCKTCASDDTCVLCARCFEGSDHDGHTVLISVSPGNSGCCDCGDHEAWKKEVRCNIHTADLPLRDGAANGKDKPKAAAPASGSQLPADLVEAIRMTISRCLDYVCDVFSCSPEQLRSPKSEETILLDERLSRLAKSYGEEPLDSDPEYALVLWNDEKHTVDDVQNQVARACARPKRFGLEKAMEVNDIGRSIVHHSRDLTELLEMAKIIEQLKVSVTIRSARDTFREQMCATIIDWIADIAGCAVGGEAHLLRNIICEELLNPWLTGSSASNKDIGLAGIDDHETEDNDIQRGKYRAWLQPGRLAVGVLRRDVELADDDDDENNDDEEDEDVDYDMDGEDDDFRDDREELRNNGAAFADDDGGDDDDDDGEISRINAAVAAAVMERGVLPPPQLSALSGHRRILTPQDSDDGEADPTPPASDAPYEKVPLTPKIRTVAKKIPKTSRHWLARPDGFRSPQSGEPCEDLWQRVRLDFLVLYDLRLWKTLRINLRHLYITTVVTIPHFKRILGLRFAGLYTALAQLYLIADREPDHSIINLSVQILTTPTITQEVVERGNFLTNLLAILYTFITTRQVGFPEAVNPKATLAFDAGAVTNRRIFHFFFDLRWLFQSEQVHQRVRYEPRYLIQFLDLVKLHQGICPNVRATGEHVEYESDTWISASMIVKEINKLCKQIAVAFEPNAKYDDDNKNLLRAIRTVAQMTAINAFGYERGRFHAAELKHRLEWHLVGPFEANRKKYSVPRHVVQLDLMSFHHPLHYLLSWLLENAKGIPREQLRTLLEFTPHDLKDPWNVLPGAPRPSYLASDEILCGVFDQPLRVCVWLSQMKAGMWVRNGITLRHQAHTYRSVSHRDVGYQRDILMIQAGLVLCGNASEMPGERFLAQMIDRFELVDWFQGDYEIMRGFEEAQQLDVIEEFFHLLVIAISERGLLTPSINDKELHDRVLQHDIAHALCFKPLSFSDLAGRVTEKVGESDDFNRVLESMTNYRSPEGLQDTGTFELKPEFIELVDPYYAHYSRNHREEAENLYKKYIARKTGKKVEDIVYEPQLQPIETGIFASLSGFTSTVLFAQVVGSALHFAVNAKIFASRVQATRVETFLHIVLHLVLLATIEDKGTEQDSRGFAHLAATSTCMSRSKSGYLVDNPEETVVQLLVALSSMDEYSSCHASIKHILRKMHLQQPGKCSTILGFQGALLDRGDTNSPSTLSLEDKERKKQEALARQAKVMAQMKQQQNSFLENQGLSSFDDEFEEFGDDMSITEEPESIDFRKTWSFPAGTCILCQEETDDQRLYGTFAFLGESNILRSTPLDDDDYVHEVLNTPESLDRNTDNIRPFGVASSNKQQVQKVTSDSSVTTIERSGVSKGFPHQENCIKGPVSTSCGHIMHFNCFELYLNATQRRHNQQIARNHPERVKCEEFICPLCKALGNTFLPIIWKAKECSAEHELHAAKDFGDWLADAEQNYRPDLENHPAPFVHQQQIQESYSNRSYQYVESMFAPPLVQSMQELSLESSPTSPAQQQQQSRFPLRRGYSLSRLFNIGQGVQAAASFAHASPDPAVPIVQSRMGDLFKAYQRIDKSIDANGLRETKGGKFVSPVVALTRALGLSVSAYEIGHRGAGNDPAALSLLADVSEQSLTHLRILSETIESYLAVHVLRSGSNMVARETLKKRETLIAQLFPDGKLASAQGMEVAGKTLFQDDIFLFFADWLSYMAPTVADASSILQLCYWAEIIKAIFVYREVFQRGFSASDALTAHDDANVEDFARVLENLGYPDMQSPHPQLQVDVRQVKTLYRLAHKYAQAFLRKCTVLMYVRYGLDFECPYNLDPTTPELQRLTSLLHIPSLDDMCNVYLAHSTGGEALRKLTRRWIHQMDHVTMTNHMGLSSSTITIAHPAIFELVGLPKNYDVLTEEAIHRRCPTTGKEVTDPTICLLCGEIFCSQAVCCLKDKTKGGCNQHMVAHGMKIGLFINIRKCMVVLLHGPGSGSFQNAPYLDRHGEPDPTLRRHHQLFLNQRRYDKLLREVWLAHMIPTVISRKLEGDINPGGWETL